VSTVTILCSDTSSNALGRAWVLAEILKDSFDVEIVGPRFHENRWFPLRDYPGVTDVRIPIPPALILRVRELVSAINGDVVYASKLRPSSFGIGLLARAAKQIKLALDIDDWEPGFFLDLPRFVRLVRFPLQFAHPNGFPYVSALEHLSRRADFVSVASTPLQRRLGGFLLYHVRDTDILDPARYQAAKTRSELGLDGCYCVMFLGTPGEHKGLEELARAVAQSGVKELCLAIVGGVDNAWVKGIQGRYGSAVRILAQQPMARLGEILSAADLVCLPQQPSRYGSYQMPAKVFDAMAMAKPIIATQVSDLPYVLKNCGLIVPPSDTEALTESILRLYRDPELASQLGRRARTRCIENFSFRSARRGLVPLFKQLVGE